MPAGVPTIRLYGSRCLRRAARPADAADPATAACLDGMWRVLERDGGVGLAAPQVGVDLRLVVVRDPQQPPGRRRLDLVNPEIVAAFGPHESFEEGCLSFPGMFARIVRPKGVELRYRDRDGAERSLRDDGLVARIVQHEIDHLDGILFIDRLGAWGRALRAPRLLWLRLRALSGAGGSWR